MAPEPSGREDGALPFSRIIRADDAGPSRTGRIEASPAEREALATLFRVENIASLIFDYALDALPSQRFRLTGEVNGTLTQLCSVTLEPVAETIREDVSLEYWPEHLIARDEGGPPESADTLDYDPPEALVGGKIDLGRVAAEFFAAAINPYPRAEGVEFAWTDEKAAAGAEAAKPFAALAKLKGKS
jgi:uncharacterized metal-binding protein YceD (DUF177 family)